MRSCIKLLLLAALLGSASGVVAEERASRESVERMLLVMRSQRQLEAQRALFHDSFNQGFASSLSGKPMSDQQKELVTQLRKEFIAAFDEQLSWEVMKPMMIDVYQDTFSQEEVDAATRFYASDVGQGMLEKLPRAMSGVAARMQERLGTLESRLAEALKKALSGAPAPQDHN